MSEISIDIESIEQEKQAIICKRNIQKTRKNYMYNKIDVYLIRPIYLAIYLSSIYLPSYLSREKCQRNFS